MNFAELTEEKKKKILDIAKKMGISVESLLTKGNPETIIEDFEKGKFQLLND